MGSAFGVAIFGSILTSRLDYNLPRLIPAGSNMSAGQLLGSTPDQLRALPAAVHAGATQAFAMSLHTMFLWVVPLSVVGFALTFLLREIPLRSYAHVGTEVPPEGVPAEPEIGHRPLTAVE